MQRLAVHWLKLLPLHMIEINYETLVADLEGETRRSSTIARFPGIRAASPFTRRRAPCERRASTRSAGRSSAPPSTAGAATGAASDR